MDARQVVALFDAFERHSIRAWAAGGWAVDALVGRETRPHNDLDLAVDADDLGALLDSLASDGFAITVDWSPARLELTATDGRIVDLHPVVFDARGAGIQSGLDGEQFHYAADGFTVGRIDGHSVPCLTAKQQLRFREGYEPRPVDLHDIPILNDLLGG